MINAHESGSNFPGAGTFRRDLTKTKSLQCRDFTWALHKEKSISPLFPGPRGGGVVSNDWCIKNAHRSAQNSKIFLEKAPNPQNERRKIPPLVPSALKDFFCRPTFKYTATALLCE